MQGYARQQEGFTLIEVALVMLILALLAGAVVGANELLLSSRARALTSEIEGYRGAYFGFMDRYRSIPGDYATATRDIAGVTVDGDGNARIESRSAGAPVDEPIALWEHLARAGYMIGGFTYGAGPETAASAPRNAFGSAVRFEYGNRYAGLASRRHNLNTGNQVPSTILAEIDRKIDDGSATTGNFRFSSFAGGGPVPDASACYDSNSTQVAYWRADTEAGTNCGATWLLP